MENREIIVSPLAFHAPQVVQVQQGTSISNIVTQLYPDLEVIVEIDGIPIPHNDWNSIPSLDSHVLISLPLHGGGGGGGKNPLRTLLTIAVVVAAVAFPMGLTALPTFAGMTWGATVSMYSVGIMTAGMMLVNALAPIRPLEIPGVQSYNDSPTYSLTGGSNRENPWGSVPVNLGVNRIYPPLGAKSYTEIVGGEEYLRMLVVWGYGPLKIEDIKIGDTLLSSYDDYELQTREGWSDDADITLFPSQVTQTAVNTLLTATGGIVTRTAEINVDELSVDISFPNGLVTFAADGSRGNRSVQVKIEYRIVGAGSWTSVETKTFTDKTTSAVRYGNTWNVDKTEEYEIGLTRITADTIDTKIIDKVYWSNIRSILDEHPIDFPYPVSASAIRIKATDQLSGMIDTLNAIVSSYCPVWDDVGEEWGSAEGDYAVTNNPAALMRWALMGNANARARVSTQIDNAILGEWYEFCETNGYAYNMYRDYKSSVWNTCADITSTGRASPNVKDGLWAVTVDTGTQTLVQHITPRNSWGFKAEKVLFTRPHAFRIKFINKDNGYIWDERIVYDDGYNSGNATLFESIEFPGITDPDLIWKFGRFHIAQARLRPEMYSLYMDFEHLVCRRGDKVRVSHDVPLWGSGWGRVKSLTTAGGNITHIILDESIAMEAATAYSCRFRLASGDTLEPLAIKLDVGETAVLELETPLLIASGPEVGDLAMFGVTNSETVELLVHSIKRADDFTAQIFLIDVATAIYTADSGEIPAFDPQTTTPIDVTTLPPDPPTIDDTESGTDVSTTSGGGSVTSLIVYLSAPANDVRIRGYRLRYRITGETQWQYTPEMQTLTITIPSVIEDVEYEIQAQSISVFGVPSTWTAVGNGTPATPQIVPSHPTGISADLVAGGSAYNYAAVAVTFTPPTDPVFSHCDVYASNDDTTYHYVGQNTTGSFVFSGMGSIYEADDTCYIKLRSVSIYELSEDMPATADDLVVITGYIRLAGFYAGSTFFGDNATPASAKILLDKTNTLIRVGPTSGEYITIDGDYGGVPAVVTSNYVSGVFGAGLLLKSDLLEVGNIASRGIIRTAVFQKDVVSAVGGNLAVLPADLLNTTMSADDEDDDFVRVTTTGDTRVTTTGDIRVEAGYGTLTIEGNESFSSGDIIRIKDGARDEWMEIKGTSAAPIYGVLRDKAGVYADGSNPEWTKGATVVNYRQSGDGFVYMTASETNAPYLSVVTHAGVPWDTLSTKVRLGNLNGYLDYISDLYGIAIGEANAYLKYDPTNGMRISGTIALENATSGKRLKINSDGMTLHVTDSTGKYGTNFKYGDGTKYGSGALAYIHHSSQSIPFFISAEQTVGDMHMYNRSSNPTGTALIGDLCVVGGKLKICTSAGTPGTWTVVGAQTV